jgi:hypothetical protein
VLGGCLKGESDMLSSREIQENVKTISGRMGVVTIVCLCVLFSLSGCASSVPLAEACTEQDSDGRTISVEGHLRVGDQTCLDFGNTVWCHMFVTDSQDSLLVMYSSEPTAIVNPFPPPSVLPVTWVSEQICGNNEDCRNGFENTWFRLEGHCATSPLSFLGGSPRGLLVRDLQDIKPILDK